MKRLILALPLLLGGCLVSPTPQPAWVEVKVPVRIPCLVVLPDRPDFAVDALPLEATIDQQMKSLRAERLQRIGYERELLAALGACR